MDARDDMVFYPLFVWISNETYLVFIFYVKFSSQFFKGDNFIESENTQYACITDMKFISVACIDKHSDNAQLTAHRYHTSWTIKVAQVSAGTGQRFSSLSNVLMLNYIQCDLIDHDEKGEFIV